MTRSACKISVKRIFAFILILIMMLSFSGCRWLAIVTFDYVSTWRFCVDDFKDYQKHFEAIAAFCLDYSQQNNTLGEDRWLFSYDFKKNALNLLVQKDPNDVSTLAWETIECSEEIKMSFRQIEPAFKNKDATFYGDVSCVDGIVYFETSGGHYSVVYSPDKKPEYLDGINKGKCKRIVDDWFYIADDWYHVVRE